MKRERDGKREEEEQEERLIKGDEPPCTSLLDPPLNQINLRSCLTYLFYVRVT